MKNEKPKHYNVIIIGAGPAGLNAGKILGDAKKRVLVLEKNSEIGPKVCAGGLTRKAVKYLNIPEELLDFRYKEIDFFTPHIKTVINLGEDFFFTIDRRRLGQWQFEKINKNFVNVKINKKVKSIEKNIVRLESGETFSFDYLIGADGSNSLVRRHLRLKTEKIGMAVQYVLLGNNFNRFQIYLNSKFFNAWYSWIFPHRDYASMGYGYAIKLEGAKKMRDNYRKWIKDKNIDISNAKKEAFPINCDYQGYQFNNIFLVGDAAGLASGYTGEGIYQALVSGDEIAHIILNKNYKPYKIKKALKERFFHHLFLRIVYHAGPLRNLIFDFVGICVKSRLLGRTLMRILS